MLPILCLDKYKSYELFSKATNCDVYTEIYYFSADEAASEQKTCHETKQ